MNSAGTDGPLPFALRQYAAAREEAFAQTRVGLGMSDLDARAFVYVCENPGVRPKELAQHLAVSSAAVTTLMDRLETRHLVERREHATDRRGLRLFATEEARESAWPKLRAFDDETEASLALEPVSDQEVAAAIIRRLGTLR